MIEAVVKVGGSLCRRDWLQPLSLRLAEVARRHALVVVPGGGSFADAVRAQDARVGLGGSTAHWMAILGMDQYGWLLTDWIPGSKPVWTLSAARAVAGDGRVPVLLPWTLLYESDPLPHAWDVTSDSIGAWVAATVGAPLLVLLKDVDGVFDAFSPQGEAPRLRERVTVEELGRVDVVDAHLPGLVARYGLDLWLLNGRWPERLAELMATGAALGTHVVGGPPDPTG